MPNKSEKQAINPSPGLFRRLMGGRVMSDSLSQQWPELQKEFVNREFDMPQEAAKTNRLMQMGPIMRWLHPDAYAVTGPLGTVALNRNLIEKEGQHLGDVLTHELTHVGQGRRGFLKNFYNPTEVEREAIDKEAMMKKDRRDVYLPPMNARK
jgi:hypothetical protein